MTEPAAAYRFTLHGRVKPYTRMTRRSMHVNAQAQQYLDSQANLAWQLREAMDGRPPLSGRVAFSVLFCRTGRRLVDLSNCIKALEDAANSLVWNDDSQVAELRAALAYECAEDYTQFHVWSLE